MKVNFVGAFFSIALEQYTVVSVVSIFPVRWPAVLSVLATCFTGFAAELYKPL
jgi:hypothetical protein